MYIIILQHFWFISCDKTLVCMSLSFNTSGLYHAIKHLCVCHYPSTLLVYIMRVYIIILQHFWFISCDKTLVCIIILQHFWFISCDKTLVCMSLSFNTSGLYHDIKHLCVYHYPSTLLVYIMR